MPPHTRGRVPLSLSLFLSESAVKAPSKFADDFSLWPCTKEYIAEAKDLHKGWQFLALTRELVGCAFAREYMESAPGTPKNALGFLKFLRSCPQDKTFTFLGKFYLLREMTGLQMFRGGLRQNMAIAISAARKLLLPTLCTRGCVNYFPTVLLEIITVQHRVHARVRQQIERFTSYKGQGWDWKMEERNRDAKLLLGSDSLLGWRFATMFIDAAKQLRDTLTRACGGAIQSFLFQLNLNSACAHPANTQGIP